MGMRLRFRLLVATAMIVGSLWGASVQAAAAPVCGALCGKWQLDTASSDDAKRLLDDAMASFKEPRGRMPDRNPRTLEGDVGAQVDQALGPINTRPDGREQRRELEGLLRIPEQLTVQLKGREFQIAAVAGSSRRLTPGESHSRVDMEGTAEIRCNFKDGRLQVTERYDRKRQYSETYAVQRGDGSLLVTREVKRQGLKTLVIRSRYRPAQDSR